MEGQIRGRRAEDSGGEGDPAGPAAGGDGRALHVPQHEGVQAATARQGLPHRKVSAATREVQMATATLATQPY